MDHVGERQRERVEAGGPSRRPAPRAGRPPRPGWRRAAACPPGTSTRPRARCRRAPSTSRPAPARPRAGARPSRARSASRAWWKREPVLVDGGARVTPVQHRALEGRLGLGIGDALARRRDRRTPEKRANSRRRPSETSGPSSGPRSLKNRKGSGAAHSSPMNSSGSAGESRSTAVAARTASGESERGDPLAEGAIADLVVVLEEAHEGGRGQVRARLAARAVPVRWSARPGTRSPR